MTTTEGGRIQEPTVKRQSFEICLMDLNEFLGLGSYRQHYPSSGSRFKDLFSGLADLSFKKDLVYLFHIECVIMKFLAQIGINDLFYSS